VVNGLVGTGQPKPKNMEELKEFLDECTLIMHFNQCSREIIYLVFVLFGKDGR